MLGCNLIPKKMKTINDLFELVGKAVNNNLIKSDTWFIDYAGHVNKISIRYYAHGWAQDNVPVSLDEYLEGDGIQSAYWFIKSRL